MNLGVEYDGRAGRAARRLTAAETLARGALNRALRRAGAVITPALQANTPRRTGRLANSTRFQIIGAGAAQALHVRQGAKTASGTFYGRFVRGGTRPHVIRPVRARALRFVMRGRVVFAASVRHPGNAPNPYHVRALEQARPALEQIARDEAVTLSARLSEVGRVASVG